MVINQYNADQTQSSEINIIHMEEFHEKFRSKSHSPVDPSSLDFLATLEVLESPDKEKMKMRI